MKKLTVGLGLAAAAALALSASNAWAQAFGAGNLVVTRVGDGTTLVNTASQVSLLEFARTGGAAVRTINLPTTVSGAQRAFTNSGTATSNLGLNLSSDGRFLTLAGYDAAIGTAGVTGSDNDLDNNPATPDINRVIARVDALGNVDTSTVLTDAYDGDNIRSAVTTNGTDIYIAGTGTADGVRGVTYTTFGTVGTPTQISGLTTATTNNFRRVDIFNGQLYGSSMSGVFDGVSTLGTGLPTTGPQGPTLLPGYPSDDNSSPFDFFFSNPDTLYVSDDRGAATGGGIRKFVRTGGNFVLQYTISTGLGTTGIRGLTGVESGGQTTLYAIGGADNASTLFSVVDGGASSSFTVLATAGTGFAFRGIDFAPSSVNVPEPGTWALFAMGGLALGGVALRRRKNKK